MKLTHKGIDLLTKSRKCVRTSFKEGIQNATKEYFHFAEDMPYQYVSQAAICEHQKGYMTESFLDCRIEYEFFQLNWSERSLQSLFNYNQRLKSRATEENCFFCKQLKVLQAEVQRMARVQSKDGLCLTCIKDEFEEHEMALYFHIWENHNAGTPVKHNMCQMEHSLVAWYHSRQASGRLKKQLMEVG